MTTEQIHVRITLPPDRGGKVTPPFEIEISYPSEKTDELRKALQILSKKKKK